MNKEIMIMYVKLYNEFKQNEFKQNPKMIFTDEQLSLIDNVNKESTLNPELSDLILKIKSSKDSNQRIELVNNFYAEKQIDIEQSYKTDTPENNQVAEDKMTFDNLSEEIKNQTIFYNEYPELLENLSVEEKNKYQEYIEMYNSKLREETKVNDAKQYVKKQSKKKTGYIDVLLLSVITGFVGGLLTTLMILFIK